jgi:LCP family protein required for cell wall assembly
MSNIFFNLFLTVVSLSALGVFAILCVMILNKIFRKNYSKQWIYIVWAVIAIRLMIPVNFSLITVSDITDSGRTTVEFANSPSSESVNTYDKTTNSLSAENKQLTGNEQQAGNEKQTGNELQAQNEINNRSNHHNSEEALQTETKGFFGSKIHINYSDTRLTILSILWLAGMLLYLAYHLITYYSFRTKISRWSITVKDNEMTEQFQSLRDELGIKRKIGIIYCKQVVSPMLIGFLKPCIVMPSKDFTAEQYHFLLKHELIHYKHHDLIYKFILLLASALHWFNPLVHYMVYLANNDIELYCDESLIANNTLNYRENYSYMLIHMLTGGRNNNNILLSTGFGTKKRQLKDRFYQIMNSKPTKKGTCFIIGLVCLIIAAGSLTPWLVPAKASEGKITEKQSDLKSPQTETTKNDTKEQLDKINNILVIGVDGNKDADYLRADSILVVSMNPDTKKIGLVSFLRDMYLEVPNHGKDKLSSVYKLGGSGLIKDTLETNFDFTIDHIVTVNMDAFENTIDSIGGVNLELSELEAEYLNSTNYISNKEYRNLIAGKQKLNGNQALGYLRVRMVPTIQGEKGDSGRTARLRGLISSVMAECSKKGIEELTKALLQIIPGIDTDMDQGQLLTYLNIVLQGEIKTESFTIPAEGSYTPKVVEGMNVLDVNLEKNKGVLKQIN